MLDRERLRVSPILIKLNVINYQSQLVDSIKQQKRLVSQRPIKLTGIETDPKYANFSKYILRFTINLCLLCDVKVSFHIDVRCSFSVSK